MKTVTACTMDCPDACSLVVSVDSGGKIRLRGNPDHPVTAGFTCRKIRRHIARLQSPDRIVRPQLRKNGGWKPISWDRALDLCAEKIDALRGHPESIVHIQGDGAKGVLKALPRLFFNRLGATRVRGSLCDAAGFMAYVHDFGSRKNHDIYDLKNAARIVNWGKDLPRSSIHMAAVVAGARKRGTRVLTISPGGDDSDRFSDAHIRIRPGTDRFLAAAGIRRLLSEKPVDARIPERSRHWKPFTALLEHWTEEDLLDACGVNPVEAGALFDAYRTTEPVATVVGAGLQRYLHGGENVRWINALALISGNIGRTGGGSYYHLHAYANLDLSWAEEPASGSRRSFLKPTVGRQIDKAAHPPIRMAWVNGINIVNQAPDIRRTARALRGIDFTVVVDAFLNDTAECADLILPAALMLEQEDIIGSFLHDFVHYVPAALPPPGEARSDDRIIADLAARLSPPVALPDKDTCLSRCLASPRLSTDLTGLKENRTARARRPSVAYEGLRFDHPDGKYRFPLSLHNEPPPPEGYPLRLLSLVRKGAIHSQMRTGDQPMPPKVWVSPDCPFLAQVDPFRDTFLASPLGRMKVRLETLEGLHPEAVVYRRGDWMKLGGGINQLIGDGVTDIGGGAPFYKEYVRLENE
jgi:anaerobic selenocysteine-containing dehydrogenase